MLAKILIIRFSSIGDIVLTTPVIRCIKKQMEDVEVHFLTKEAFRPIISANPYIDKVITYQNKISDVINQLTLTDYTYVVDLHNNLRSTYVKARLRSFSFTVNKINFRKWLAVNLKVNKLPNKHVVDRYMETVRPLGVYNDFIGLDYHIPDHDQVDFSLIPSSHRKNFVAIVIGGTYFTKRLPTNQLIKLCKAIKKPMFLLGGEGDKFVADQIKKEVGERAYNGVGIFSINESASVVQRAEIVVTHDTGLMHIASAFKKRIFSIWGNTIPEFGMYPYMSDQNSKIYEVKGLKCRPCSKLGYSKCPKSHFNCMNQIDMLEIAEEINSID
ncbi:MAG: glycosyltransferase family 9 protein [Flavobacteriales bacterium]|nr:glycosyltransferase family 9 protein [Flavobacteriales bacterium]